MARTPITWHPIYIEPIEGSGERLTIAIAGGTADVVRFKVIGEFRETFGPDIEAALAAKRPMLDALAGALRHGPIDLLASAEELGPGLFVGEARRIMTADIDAALEAAALITSTVFNARPDRKAEHDAEPVEPFQWDPSALRRPASMFDNEDIRAAVGAF